MPRIRWTGVCIDCADARELAGFYARFLGWRVTAENGDWIQLGDPAGGVGLNIQGDARYTRPVWPERPGAQGKMLHFEIAVEDVDAAVTFAVECGATVAAAQPADRDPQRLRVMFDPAGHPFCLYNDG